MWQGFGGSGLGREVFCQSIAVKTAPTKGSVGFEIILRQPQALIKG